MNLDELFIEKLKERMDLKPVESITGYTPLPINGINIWKNPDDKEGIFRAKSGLNEYYVFYSSEKDDFLICPVGRIQIKPNLDKLKDIANDIDLLINR